MGKKETFGFADEIEFVHRDKTGKIINRWTSKGKTHNCLTNVGFAQVAGLILTDTEAALDKFDFIGIGTGTTGALATDTDLETSKKRKAAVGTRVTTTVANDTSQLVATFSSADGLSGTDAITEVGVFTLVAAGVMLMRQTFTAESMDWSAGDTLEMTVKVQAKQGA